MYSISITSSDKEAGILYLYVKGNFVMAAGEISREQMINFIREKDEFYAGVDLTKLNSEELTLLWETVRAAWLLGQEKKLKSRGMTGGEGS